MSVSSLIEDLFQELQHQLQNQHTLRDSVIVADLENFDIKCNSFDEARHRWSSLMTEILVAITPFRYMLQHNHRRSRLRMRRPYRPPVQIYSSDEENDEEFTPLAAPRQNNTTQRRDEVKNDIPRDFTQLMQGLVQDPNFHNLASNMTSIFTVQSNRPSTVQPPESEASSIPNSSELNDNQHATTVPSSSEPNVNELD